MLASAGFAPTNSPALKQFDNTPLSDPFLENFPMEKKYSRPPGFGQRVLSDDYYVQVDQIIATLRGTASQRVIADHLNRHNFTTPKGLPFNRERVAQYLRRTKV